MRVQLVVRFVVGYVGYIRHGVCGYADTFDRLRLVYNFEARNFIKAAVTYRATG